MRLRDLSFIERALTIMSMLNAARFMRFLLTPGVPRKQRLACDFLRLKIRRTLGAKGTGSFRLLDWRIDYGDFDLFYGLVWEVFITRQYALPTQTPLRRIIDAGANIGLSALFFALEHPQSRIICFEPEPRNYELLRRNIEQNQLQQRVDCRQLALSDHEGVLVLYTQSNMSGGDVGASSSREARLHYHAEQSIASCEVPCGRLSPFLSEPVDLLKLDVEGAEAAVFPEISEAFGNVRALIMEYHHFPAGNPLSAILRILEQHHHRYTIMPLTARPLEDDNAGFYEMALKSARVDPAP
jgi:FkbM family methyltransferase